MADKIKLVALMGLEPTAAVPAVDGGWMHPQRTTRAPLDQQPPATTTGPEGSIVFLEFGNDPRGGGRIRLTWHDG